MAISQQPSRFVFHWLCWVECAFLVVTTGFMALFVMGGVPILDPVGNLFLIGWFVSPPILGFGTVFWLAVRSQHIKESLQGGVVLLLVSEMLALGVVALVRWLYLSVYLDCQRECGNPTLAGYFFLGLPILGLPILSMLLGMVAESVASFLAWGVLRLWDQKHQVRG